MSKLLEDNATKIIEILKKTYPDAQCSLNFKNPFELLVAVVLSAQCTDERVNKTTPAIFEKYNTPLAFSKIDIHELEELIHPCGFYHTKAENLKACAQKLVDDFNGEVPKTMEELTSLPGVGRKSANVIMLNAFNNPVGIAIDTHAKRICNRLGLSKETEPLKIEKDLLKILKKEYIKDANHLLVYHGRNLCTARNPKCIDCPLNKLCTYYQKSK